MSFSLNKEQLDIQKAAREFAEGEIRPVARELDSQERFDDRIWKKAAELGFLAVFVEEKYDVAHYWRNAKVLEIFEGSKEIEKIIIGKKVLGTR